MACGHDDSTINIVLGIIIIVIIIIILLLLLYVCQFYLDRASSEKLRQTKCGYPMNLSFCSSNLVL